MDGSGQKIDKSKMKRSNLRLLFSEIQRRGEVSRAQLARATGLSSMTVGRLSDEFIQKGLLLEEELPAAPLVGRRPRALRINAPALLSLGVELSGSSVRAGVMDLNGVFQRQLVWKEDFLGGDPRRVAEVSHRLICQLMQEQEGHEFVECGVACPGIIDSRRGVVRFSAAFQWREAPLLQLLREQGQQFCQKGGQPLQFVLDNELKARGRAEALFGVAKNRSHAALLHLGHGVGSALLQNGQIYRGRGNMAGEIGHICIDPAGVLCQCGQRGCLQTFLTLDAVLGEARKFVPHITPEGVFLAYEEGKPWAVSVVEHLVGYAKIAVEMLERLYAPDLVILCGDTVELYPPITEMIRRRYQQQSGRLEGEDTEIQASFLGENGNLQGACTMAFYRGLDRLCQS